MWDKDLSYDNHDRSISKCDQLLPEADNNFQIMIILDYRVNRSHNWFILNAVK